MCISRGGWGQQGSPEEADAAGGEEGAFSTAIPPLFMVVNGAHAQPGVGGLQERGPARAKLEFDQHVASGALDRYQSARRLELWVFSKVTS